MLLDNIENLQESIKDAILDKLRDDFPDGDVDSLSAITDSISELAEPVMQYIVDNAVVVGDKIE